MNTPNFELILSALNEGPHGIILIAPNEQIVFWNRWLEVKTGIKLHQAERNTIEDVFPSLVSSRVINAIKNALTNGLPSILSHKLNSTPFPILTSVPDVANGMQMCQMVRIKSLKQADKQRYALIQIEDITQAVIREDTLRRQAQELVLREQEILESREAALQASSAKSDFLANMSHEIRTPLNAIIGLTTLAIDSKSHKEKVNYLCKIESASNTLLGLINDILDFSKIEAGKLELESHYFVLNEIIAHLLDLFSGPAQAKDIQLTTNIATNIPRNFFGDGLRLRQVLINLVNNAIKFTHHGKIAIHIDRLENQNGKDSEIDLYFQVIDTGIGLKDEHIDKLFQSFTQADGSTSRKFGGTGLGLAISKQLVELMGGSIWVKSEENVGSNFQFSVRLAVAKEAETDSRQHIVLHEKRNMVRLKQGLRGLRVLLVEDNEINQQVAAEIMKGASLQVTIANHGLEALEILKTTMVDAILMDVQMPVMDGFQATEAIRKQTEFKDLPIIAITANAMQGDRQRCLESGMTDYISKPIRQATLFSCLAKWLTKDGAEDNHTSSSDIPNSEISSTENYSHSGSCLDTKMGLQFLDNNTELYISLLMMFCKRNRDTLQNIKQDIDNGNFKNAILLTHTLKGTAINLGATNLNQTSARLESALWSERQDELPELLETLKIHLGNSIAAAEDFISKQHKPAGASTTKTTLLDNTKLPELLREILHSLQSNNMKVIGQFADIKPLFKSDKFQSKMDTLANNIDMLDFEQAAQTLRALALSANINLENQP